MTTSNETESVETHHFPTHAAYLVPVEIKDIPEHGEGQRGVFATECIPEGTKMWVWTHRITSIHRNNLQSYIDENFGTDQAKIKEFLRQGFVLPPSSTSETMTPPPASHAGAQSDDSTTKTPTTPPVMDDSNKDDFFHSNPTDSGRLTNHSVDPNTGPDGSLRDILPGEELTMDYSFHGNPVWYQTICAKYGELTESQVAVAAAAAAQRSPA